MLSEREHTTELMDDFSVKGVQLKKALQEIALINRWLGGHPITLSGIKQIWQKFELHNKQPVHIGDVGCGGGDTLFNIAHWRDKNNYKLRLTGVDANPHIINYAKQLDNENWIQWLCEDIFSPAFKKHHFDILISSLFCHHFTNDELVQMLKQWKNQVRYAILINDLHRHIIPYATIKTLTQLFSKSEMVRYDAPISVKRGFKRSEWHHILQKAGLTNYTIKWRWAFRHQLIIYL